MTKENNEWFEQCKVLKSKIIEKNKEITKLDKKIKEIEKIDKTIQKFISFVEEINLKSNFQKSSVCVST